MTEKRPTDCHGCGSALVNDALLCPHCDAAQPVQSTNRPVESINRIPESGPKLTSKCPKCGRDSSSQKFAAGDHIQCGSCGAFFQIEVDRAELQPGETGRQELKPIQAGWTFNPLRGLLIGIPICVLLIINAKSRHPFSAGNGNPVFLFLGAALLAVIFSFQERKN